MDGCEVGEPLEELRILRAPKPAREAGPAPLGGLGEMVGLSIIETAKPVFV
jgi:hypothetical protein